MTEVTLSPCFICNNEGLTRKFYFKPSCPRVESKCGYECDEYRHQFGPGKYYHCPNRRNICNCGTCDSEYRICPECETQDPLRFEKLQDLISLKTKYGDKQEQIDLLLTMAAEHKNHTLPQQMPATKLIQELQNIEELQKTLDDLKKIKDAEIKEDLLSYQLRFRPYLGIDNIVLMELMAFSVTEDVKCAICEIMDESSVKLATYARIEQTKTQQDSSYVVTFICERCQHNYPSHSSTLFSKDEVIQMTCMSKKDRCNFLGKSMYKRFITKLIGLQSKSTFLSSAEEKQVKEKLKLDEQDSFDSFVELLNTKKIQPLADQKIQEFRIREHKKVEEIADEAKQLLDNDFVLIRNMLCYLRNKDDVHKHNPIETINKVITSHRFKELMNDDFTYLDYVKSNDKYWSLKPE